MSYKQVLITILQRSPLMTASATISLSSLKKSPLQSKYEEKDLLPTFFRSFTQSPSFDLVWEHKTLNITHSL